MRDWGGGGGEGGVPISGSPWFSSKGKGFFDVILLHCNYFLMPFNVAIINPKTRVLKSAAGVPKIFYG